MGLGWACSGLRARACLKVTVLQAQMAMVACVYRVSDVPRKASNTSFFVKSSHCFNGLYSLDIFS